MAMAKQSIEKRIKAIEESKEKHPELEKLLEFYEAILLAQKEIEAHPGRGTKLDLSDRKAVQELQQKAKESRKPISSLLDAEIFLPGLLVSAFSQVIEELPDVVKAEMKDFLEASKTGRASVIELAGATLKEDPEYFEKRSKEHKINPRTLLFIANSLIQPLLEEIARQLDSSFLELWWEAQCPICGKRPVVARIRNRKRYLVCAFCGAEYLADLFLCVHCGNLDPKTLAFLQIETKPWLRIDYCEKCKHYLKVIDDDKMKTPFPNGLEDVLTISLDRVAKEAGLLS